MRLPVLLFAFVTTFVAALPMPDGPDRPDIIDPTIPMDLPPDRKMTRIPGQWKCVADCSGIKTNFNPLFTDRTPRQICENPYYAQDLQRWLWWEMATCVNRSCGDVPPEGTPSHKLFMKFNHAIMTSCLSGDDA